MAVPSSSWSVQPSLLSVQSSSRPFQFACVLPPRSVPGPFRPVPVWFYFPIVPFRPVYGPFSPILGLFCPDSGPFSHTWSSSRPFSSSYWALVPGLFSPVPSPFRSVSGPFSRVPGTVSPDPGPFRPFSGPFLPVPARSFQFRPVSFPYLALPSIYWPFPSSSRPGPPRSRLALFYPDSAPVFFLISLFTVLYPYIVETSAAMRWP